MKAVRSINPNANLNEDGYLFNKKRYVMIETIKYPFLIKQLIIRYINYLVTNYSMQMTANSKT